ncbi:6110_t:CDS:2, partial [Diversispora eburnea]
IIDNEIKCCNGETNLRPLKQMIGTWEIDANMVKDIKNNNYRLEVPCIGVHKCSAFIEGPIAHKSSSGYCAQYICSECFEQHGGHLYKKPGRGRTVLLCTEQGKHDNDTSDSLKYIGKWIMSIAESNNQENEDGKIAKQITCSNCIEGGKNNGSTFQPLFGESSFTNNLLMMYENTLNTMLENNGNAFDMEDVHSKITEQISTDAFNCPDSNTHSLFKSVPELNEEGISKILSLYEIGKMRFQQILAQDVYKTEPRITSGRRARNINAYTYAQLLEREKKANKQVDNPTQVSTTQQNISSASLPLEIEHQKKTRRTITEVEKAILKQLFEFEQLSEDIVSK